jgi:type IV secretion system protein VirD4
MQTNAHNEAYGDFGLPTRPSQRLRFAPIALLAGAALFALTHQLRTQWIAESLHYQAALGKPLFVAYDIPVYGFWRSFAWLDRLAAMPSAATLVGNASLWSFFANVLSAALTLHLLVRGARSNKNRAGVLHGSAEWATKDDIVRAGLFATKGIVAGKWLEVKWFLWTIARYLRHDGGEHVLVLAPTGTGKGVGLVLPTLLTATTSALVLDPKGENYAKTSGWRKRIGQCVFKLDFSAPPSETAAFNPLSAIRLRTPHEVADAQRIAGVIVNPEGKPAEGNARYFQDTASALLTGAILHVLYRDAIKSRCASLSDVLDELSDPQRTHHQVLMDWLSFPHDPTFSRGWVQGGLPSATHHVVATAARQQLNRDERDRSPILSSAVAPLSLFLDPTLVANTSHSDFVIEDLMDRDKPMTLYLVTPADDNHRLRPLIRILLDLMIRRLMPPMKLVGSDLVSGHKHELLLMLDEFPQLGKLDVFTESIATMRGWGIRSYLICQDYEQLRDAYGNHETISSNCQLLLAYAPNRFETAQRLSQMLGTKTVVKLARSASQSIGHFAAVRSNESEQEVARPLLTPDECGKLPGPVKRGRMITKPGDMLVLFAGMPPIYAQQPLYFKDPTLLARSRIPPAPPKASAAPCSIPALTPSAAPATAPALARPATILPPRPAETSSTAPAAAALTAAVATSPAIPPAPTTPANLGLDEDLMAIGAGLTDSRSDDEIDQEESEDEDPFPDDSVLGDEVDE